MAKAELLSGVTVLCVMDTDKRTVMFLDKATKQVIEISVAEMMQIQAKIASLMLALTHHMDAKELDTIAELNAANGG